MKRTYYRGDIYFADLGRGIGSEQHGRRPVVIIQNNTGNRFSPTVIVAAVSSKVGVKAKLPTHYYLGAVNGLDAPSIVLLEQLRTVDKRRLTKYIGRLSDEDIRAIDHALAISVGLVKPKKKRSMTLCLCPACAKDFRNTGDYDLRQVNSKREICSYCNARMGVEYEVKSRPQKGGYSIESARH